MRWYYLGVARNDPFTVRLSPRIEARIEQIARATKRSKGAVLEELADEAERTRRFPGIAFRGPDWSRRPWVLGSSLDVWEMVQAWKDWSEDSTRLLKDSELSERQLNLALAYYREFKDEVDEAIAANRRSLDELASEYPFIESAVPRE
jgi:hypothetical protein